MCIVCVYVYVVCVCRDIIKPLKMLREMRFTTVRSSLTTARAKRFRVVAQAFNPNTEKILGVVIYALNLRSDDLHP